MHSRPPLVGPDLRTESTAAQPRRPSFRCRNCAILVLMNELKFSRFFVAPKSAPTGAFRDLSQFIVPLWTLFAVFSVPISQWRSMAAEPSRVIETGPAEQLALPPPRVTRGVANPSRVVAWPKGKLPSVPAGFEVSLFADDLDNPRMLYVLPNRDVLVLESLRRQGPSRILLYRDENKDGKAERRAVFLDNLNGAFGMAINGNRFYVGNTDGIVVFPYRNDALRIERQGEKILDLPSGGHYTRNIVVDPTGKKLYISVGSATNVDEEGIEAN